MASSSDEEDEGGIAVYDMDLMDEAARDEAEFMLAEAYFDAEGSGDEGDDGEDFDDEDMDDSEDDDNEGGVFCDECGENPMEGRYYKSTSHRNYDICPECLQENYNNDATGFMTVEGGLLIVTGEIPEELEPPEGVSIVCESFEELAHHEGIQDPNSDIDDITLYLPDADYAPTAPTVQDQAILVRSLSNHTKVKEMEIQVFGSEPDKMTPAIVAVANGLQHNTSIYSVAWTIFYYDKLSEEACQAIKNLMINNTIIRFMFFFRPEFQPLPGTLDPNNHQLQDYLFDALLTTHINTFRFECHDSSMLVTKENQKKACQAMKVNPHVKRIKMKMDKNDYMLELLRRDKKHQWTHHWSTLSETSCWNVLEAALRDCHPLIDPVFVIYHFLRSRPAVIFQ